MDSKINTVLLSEEEYNYCISSAFMPEAYRRKIKDAKLTKKGYFFQLPENDMDEMRELFGIELQRVGFDENYDATSCGRILESLIDKFYIN